MNYLAICEIINNMISNDYKIEVSFENFEMIGICSNGKIAVLISENDKYEVVFIQNGVEVIVDSFPSNQAKIQGNWVLVNLTNIG